MKATIRRFDPALCCQHDWLRCHDAESGLTLELCTRDGCAAVCTRDASGAIEEFAADGFLECAGQGQGAQGAQP